MWLNQSIMYQYQSISINEILKFSYRSNTGRYFTGNTVNMFISI